MTTARLRNRIEAAEDKMGGSADDEFCTFYVSGGNGRGPGGHDAPLSDFLALQGHDMSHGKRAVIVHFCPPWNGETKTFTPAPLVDLTASKGARAA